MILEDFGSSVRFSDDSDHRMWIKVTGTSDDSISVSQKLVWICGYQSKMLVRIGSEMITKCELRVTQFMCPKS